MRLLLIILLSVILSEKVVSQCQHLDIVAYTLLIDCEYGESINDIEPCTDRDQVIFSMIKIRNEGSFAELIELFKDYATKSLVDGKVSELDFLVYYVFADVQSSFGRDEITWHYYEFLEKKTKKESVIHILSYLNKIGVKNYSVVEDSVKFIMRDKILSIESHDEKAVVLLKYLDFYSDEHIISKSEISSAFEKVENNRLKRVLFYTMNEFFLREKLVSTNEIDAIAEEVSIKNGNSCNEIKSADIRAKILSGRKKYEEALQAAKTGVQICFGEFKSNEELLAKLRFKSNYCTDITRRYAHAKLYLTRLGYDLETVVDAFKIYEQVEIEFLESKIKETENLTSIGKGVLEIAPLNLLIIGTYLSQNGENIDYLNRAIAQLEMVNGGSLQEWIKKRVYASSDDRYAKFLNKKTKLFALENDAVGTVDFYSKFQTQVRIENLKDEVDESTVKSLHLTRDEYRVNLLKLKNELGVDSSSLLMFYDFEKTIYRIFVNKDTLDVREIDYSKSIRLINELNSELRSNDKPSLLVRNSRALYRLLFAGIETELSRKINIISTRDIERIPFPLLRKDTTGQAPQYLGVEHALSRQYSINTMQRLKNLKRKAKKSEVLGFAPQFNFEPLAASELRQAGYNLPPLFYSQQELAGIDKLGRGKYQYEEEATLETYRAKAPDYSILHFATHAISSKMDGLRSRVYLLDESGQPAPLYASDIGTQTLNADLVTLSACETGGGSQNVVEGTVGLTKAFLAAGARSVVASNWAVDDFATAELMQYFYAALRQGKTPDRALQDARREYLTKHPDAHPAKWAAFEAYGGMVAPQWAEEKPWYQSFWPYLAGFLLLLLGGVTYKRRNYA